MISDKIAFAINWASWSSIFAGTATAIAISIVMAMLGTALGFSVLNPKSEDPASGLGIAFGGWSFLSILVSMGGGGFIAGLFSGIYGIEHGFMVWAMTTIVATFFGSIAIGCAMKLIGGAAKSVGSGLVDATATVAGGTAKAVSGLVSEMKDSMEPNLDAGQIGDNVASVLRDTKIDVLQPEYLQKQMREAKSDLRTALYQLALKPNDYNLLFSNYLVKQQARLKSITGGIDRQTAVKGIMQTRNIPQQEAETLVENAFQAYYSVRTKAEQGLHEVQSRIQDMKSSLDQWLAEAREKADQASAYAARTAMLAAAGMILAAFVSMGAAFCGAQSALNWYAIQASYVMPM